MKVLLIRPFFCIEKSYLQRFISEPLGIEYLAAFLKRNHQIKIIDSVAEGWNNYHYIKNDEKIVYKGLHPKKLLKNINKYQADVIGITWLFSTQNDCVNNTINIIKQNNPKIKIVVGGPHPSTKPKGILESNRNIDIVIYGEGEITFKELLDKKLEKLESIKGIGFRNKNNQIKINSPRPLIEDLDQLPIPARDLVPYQNYNKQFLYAFLYNRFKKWGLKPNQNKILTAKISCLPLLDKIYFSLHNQIRKNKLLPMADIITSRGCPNQCAFCAIHNLWGHRWRMRSVNNVLKEIDVLVNQYGIKHLNIQDDNFNISKKRIIKICQELIKKNYNLTLTANSGVYLPSLDKEVLIWLKKAGFNFLRMSIESGNQNVLDKIVQKRINLKKIKEMVTICRQLNIRTEGVFMFGLPGETIQTMQDTINFAKAMNFDRIIKFIFQPFPNTKLYDICVKNNYLTKEYNPKQTYVTGNQCYVKTEKFSPKDVIKIAREN